MSFNALFRNFESISKKTKGFESLLFGHDFPKMKKWDLQNEETMRSCLVIPYLILTSVHLQIDDTDIDKWNNGRSVDNELPPKLWDETVENFLEYSLHSRDPRVMTKNMISGLLSRITPAVVWVAEEPKLHDICDKEL